MYDDDLSIDEAMDWYYEEDMKWRDKHPIRARWSDFKTWLKWRVSNLPRYIKNFITTGKFEDELPF
tara:strand:- start:1390 stop:1587 length:198 start_codon:yes stop_codon:yes gene_type:complete